MKNEWLISILLPVFNAENYLEECLDSIIAQTVSSWEVLAVNDFSTDESEIILKKYAQKDQRIQYFNNRQKGIIPALRLAFQKSKGHFISRMDADDKMTPDKLALLKNQLEKSGAGYVSTGLVKYFSNEDLGDGYRKYEQWLNNLNLSKQPFSDIYKECVIPSPCWMVQREDMIKCGAFGNNVYPEDYDLCFRFYQKKLKVITIPKVIHLWRDHPERTSRNDPKYANQHYFDLKLPYFLKIDYDKTRPLILWGAGKKGKILAKKLITADTPFHWITNNAKKSGKHIFRVLLQKETFLDQLPNPQLIIAVAAPDGQIEILNLLKNRNCKAGEDYFFFC